nr:transglutaminase domain-containing protein [uncultured Marinifilum sp.]
MSKHLILISVLFLFIIKYSEAQTPIFKKYRTIDQHVKKTPDNVCNNLIDLHAYLVSGANSKEEEIRAFYFWIINNIEYKDCIELKYDDRLLFYMGSNNCTSPACVLRKKQAVCEGFSRLFQFFCKHSGYECYSISGYISKNGALQDRATHSWNVVKINGKWRFFDLSWSNAILHYYGIKSKTNKFFMVEPEEFVLTHLAIIPMWQFLKTPVSIQHFNGGEQEIKKYLSQSKINYNYTDSLKYFNSLTNKKKRLKTAAEILKTNPRNKFNLAIEYYRYSRIVLHQIDKIGPLEYYNLINAEEKLNKAILLFKSSTDLSSKIMQLNANDNLIKIQKLINSESSNFIYLK